MIRTVARYLFGKSIKETTKKILKEKAFTLVLASVVYGGMYLYERRQDRKRKEAEADSATSL